MVVWIYKRELGFRFYN